MEHGTVTCHLARLLNNWEYQSRDSSRLELMLLLERQPQRDVKNVVHPSCGDDAITIVIQMQMKKLTGMDVAGIAMIRYGTEAELREDDNGGRLADASRMSDSLPGQYSV